MAHLKLSGWAVSGIPESIGKGYSRTQEPERRAFLELPDLGDVSRPPPAPFNVMSEKAGAWELEISLKESRPGRSWEGKAGTCLRIWDGQQQKLLRGQDGW